MTPKDKYFIPREREVMFTPCYWNTIIHSSVEVKKLYGVALKQEIAIFSGGSMRTIISASDWNRVANHIAGNFFKRRTYFNKIQRLIERRKTETENFITALRSVDFAGQDPKFLASLAKKLQSVWFAYDSANVPAWFFGGDRFKELLNEQINIADKDFEALITPAAQTFVNQLDRSLVMARVAVAQGASIDKEAIKLSNDYGWVPFGYDGPVFWGSQYFVRLIKKDKFGLSALRNKLRIIDEKEQKEIAQVKALKQKHQLTDKQLRLIEIMHHLTLWTDERKKLEFQLHYFYSRIINQLGRQFGATYKQLKYLFVEELSDLEKNRDKLFALAEWRINNALAYKTKTGIKGKFMSQKELSKLLLELSDAKQTNEIKGMVASRGKQDKYRGKVRIVLNSIDSKKIAKGDFLVTAMTTPDFIHGMKKALGYITDEGGVTSHAAIVARELDKPCIIGTKNATKVLHDGDMVEIDMKTGVVKILK